MAALENFGRGKYGQGITIDLSPPQPATLLSLPIIFPAVHAPGAHILTLAELDPQQQKQYTLISPAKHLHVIDNATVIIIPKDTIISITITSNDISHAERIIIVAEAGSVAEITEIAPIGEYKTQIVQIYVRENAHVKYSSLQQGEENSHLLSLKQGEVHENGVLEWRDYLFRGRLTQVHLQTTLRGRNSRTKKITLFAGKGQGQIDLFAEAIHSAPESFSAMYGRGMVDGAARAIYRGNIKVEKCASRCKGEQRADALLLGDQSRCDAIPMLEVENDSVSCSHGLAIGRINPEQLFYLTSRGLEEKEARELLVQGFLEPLLQEFPPKIQQALK